jgi:hypothetical protein
LAGGPLAALLPVLAMSLASERQRQRVESALAEVEHLLLENVQLVRQLSDAQYKLVNETVLTYLQTTDAAKLEYLRRVVHNTLSSNTLQSLDAAFLGRVVRDISAQEIVFLTRAFKYEAVRLVRTDQMHEDDSDRVLSVSLESPDVGCVSGLVSLGILASGGAAFIDLGQFRFMPVAAKLLALLREPR